MTTSTYVTDWWTDRRLNGHGMTAKTVLTRSISRLKLHQIVLMCCCTASIIHTYLLTAVPSWLKLWTVNTVFSILALVLAYALCVTCSYSCSSLPGISLRGTNVPGNFLSREQKYRGPKSPWTHSPHYFILLWSAHWPLSPGVKTDAYHLTRSWAWDTTQGIRTCPDVLDSVKDKCEKQKWSPIRYIPNWQRTKEMKAHVPVIWNQFRISVCSWHRTLLPWTATIPTT